MPTSADSERRKGALRGAEHTRTVASLVMTAPGRRTALFQTVRCVGLPNI